MERHRIGRSEGSLLELNTRRVEFVPGDFASHLLLCFVVTSGFGSAVITVALYSFAFRPDASFGMKKA